MPQSDPISSVRSVREALGGLRLHHMRENWWLNDYRTDLTDEIRSLCGMDLARRVYSRDEIRKVVAQATKLGSSGFLVGSTG